MKSDEKSKPKTINFDFLRSNWLIVMTMEFIFKCTKKPSQNIIDWYT